MRFRSHFALMPVVLLLAVGCDLFRAEAPSNLALGEHLAGLQPGDDSLAVVAALGSPQTKTTDGWGNRLWRYTTGASAGLTVVLADSGVVRVRAEAPFEIESRGGIGLGSERSRVHAVWGTPTRSNDLDTLRYELYVYAATGRFFGVEYRSDRVVAVEVEGWDTTPGIVWGESIEGVRIGDDSLTVIQKLGEPTWISIETPESRFFVYQDDRSNQKEILLLIGYGVFSYQIVGASRLMTSEGIGVGTPREELLRKFGKPAYSENGDMISDSYHFGHLFFWIQYSIVDEQVIVFRIGMQQLLP